MRRIAASLALVALLVAAPSAGAADAVVGFFDTGINPYHTTFRDGSERAQQHPSTYLPGYPKDAERLELTLSAESWELAVAADCAKWRAIEPGRLYWVPGTKIVGAITFKPLPLEPVACEEGDPRAITDSLVLDNNGHGTMVASRGASREYGACRDCLIVAAQWSASIGSRSEADAGIDWLAANSHWVDAASHSWGPYVFGAWEPTGAAELLVGSPQLARKAEMAARRHLTFWASGNGAAGRGGVIGSPTQTAPQMTPSVISVGGHDSGYVNTWPGFPPLVVSDSCASWAADVHSIDRSEDSIGSGTSAATPFAAGGAARLALEARALVGDRRTGVRGDAVARGVAGRVASGPLADGVLTLDEWRELLLKSASPRPKGQFEDGPTCLGAYGATPVKWADVPPGYPEYVHIGYGAVDDEGRAVAFKVLRGETGMPDRAATDEFFAQDAQLRTAVHDVYTLGEEDPGPAPADPGPEPGPEPGDGSSDGGGPSPAAPAPAGGSATPARPARPPARRSPRMRRVAISRLAAVPSAARCVPRARVRVRIRRPGSVREARVLVGGQVGRLLRGRALRRPALARRVPPGRFVLRIEVDRKDGSRLYGERRYRSCPRGAGAAAAAPPAPASAPSEQPAGGEPAPSTSAGPLGPVLDRLTALG